MGTSTDLSVRQDSPDLRPVVDSLLREMSLAFLRHRSTERTSGTSAVVEQVTSVDDESLLARIAEAYNQANRSDLGPAASMWLGTYSEFKTSIHDALVARDFDRLRPIFRDPRNSMLFYGFDNLNSAEGQEHNADFVEFHRSWAYDNLRRIAEAIGAVELEYPEAPPKAAPLDPELILGILDRLFGFRIEFPNLWRKEFGLKTSRGIASYRAVQALYQAWLIAQHSRGRVVEIGGGLGRTAYYAKKFGVKDYTIIDIPMTGIAQAYFLGACGLRVQLYGERRPGDVSVQPPAVFMERDGRYDLVVNVDSFTEMAEETAAAYIAKASQCSARLISINHEYNSFTVRALMERNPACKNRSRDPYWLRRGYVTEVAHFAHD